MAIRAKKLNKRAALSESARLWLDGKKECGFFKFKSQDELQVIWDQYGNEDSMWWRLRFCLPITRAELEDHEERWLESGEHGQYGGNNSYVDQQYTDDEKQALWNERGDKTRFRWRVGMGRPESIDD